MIKLELKKTEFCPLTNVDLYNSISRIPFSVTIDGSSPLPETIYCRNMWEGNFVELRFNKESKIIYEITLVTIGSNKTMFKSANDETNVKDFFKCYIIEEMSILENSLPIQVVRFVDAIKIDFNFSVYEEETKYCIGKNCFVGVNENLLLCSILINGLAEKDLINIFGF